MSTETNDLRTQLEFIDKLEDATSEQPPDTVNVDGPSAGTGDFFADPHSWTEHAAHVYAKSVKKMMPNSSPPVADLKAQAMGIIERLKPRDPAEELLVSQMLWTHARLMFLTRFANTQTNMKWSALMHNAAERAANLYRKQMLTLAEYRKPRRSPRRHSFTTIRTANIHAQQVMTQPPFSSKHPARQANALGVENPSQEKTDRRTQTETAAGDQGQQTLAEEHGAEKLSG